MRTEKAGLAALVFMGFGVLSSPAFSADGTITINGQVSDATCDVGINGATGGDYTLTLPTVQASSLAAAGAVAGSTQFTFNLSGCTATTATQVRAYFEANNVDPATGNLVNNAATTPAAEVQVQITDNALNPIDLRTNTGNQFVPFTSGENVDLTYAAQYIATGISTAGMVETQLVYSLEYM